MKRILVATGLLLSIAVAVAQQPFPSTNPLASASTLPYQAPPFDKIKDTDYQPAMDEGMRLELAEIEKIASNPEAATFANTIEAMERAGALLQRVQRAFGVVTQANTNPTIQKIQAEEAPKLAAHRDAIVLNQKLFGRVKTLYDKRDTLKLDPESKNLLEKNYKNFVRAGAMLSEADAAKMKALNTEQAKLNSDFRRKLLADTNASAVVVDNVSELDGLPEADIAVAAETAKSRGLAGKYVIALQNTTQQPAQVYLKNRALRERLFKASMMRGHHAGENDLTPIVKRLTEIRAERAALLGFSNYALYGVSDQMAKTPDNAIKLMTDMVPATVAKAHAEAERMQKMIGSAFKLEPWDWQYYAEQVRKADYEIDESQVKQYFELDRVLRDGVFYAANRLYGITFKERKDIPVYQSDVRVWEVTDADGSPLALFYLDPYQRSNKAGGAWTSSFVDQNDLFGTKAVVYNVENFTKPAPGQPALISFSDTTTMFHEFGHALHAMFSKIKYPGSGGTPRDWVEFPSQFNEHWATEPEVFANFAKHYKTGAPMPKDLVDKIHRAQTFDQGFATTEYLAAALLDMAWHMEPVNASIPEVEDFEQAALHKYKIDVPEIPPRYHTTYFSHIWTNGYSAGYYGYIWSELLDDDAYYWFRENGGMTRANGDRFRKMILAPRGKTDLAELFRAFRGRDPIADPLLIERGLKPGH
jgi:peptidyl-dipeptidase Dcp